MKIKHKPIAKKKAGKKYSARKKYSGPGKVFLLYDDILPGEFQRLCDEHELLLGNADGDASTALSIKPKARRIKRKIDDMANLLQSRLADLDG